MDINSAMLMSDAGVIDDVGDVSVMHMKAQEAHEKAKREAAQNLQKLVDGNQKPLAAVDGPTFVDPNVHPSHSPNLDPSPSPNPNSNPTSHDTHAMELEEKSDGRHKYKYDGKTGLNRIVQRTIPTPDEEIIYNSLDRPVWYHAFAWLWCGCVEPKYKITTNYIIGEQWENCVIITDGMAMENVTDVQRRQSCFYACLSCCPLCPCFNDMSNIIILGQDDSHEHGWLLKRIHRSQVVFDKLTRIIQSTHADWRNQTRNLGRKLQQVKQDTVAGH